MKKVILTILAAGLLQSASAQQYVIVDGELPIIASDISKITYEADDQFASTLLDAQLAADPNTQLFAQALQLTGLADTLKAYWRDYECIYPDTYRYRSHVYSEVAWYVRTRPKEFTVFAETDDVFAAQGINNINQLKAYAKQVYDAVYPEDASITDPTNRRNSLNRFVAYHILPFYGEYYNLTAFDGRQDGIIRNFDTNLADVSAWYATIMSGASLKCSFPQKGDIRGLYLNRRGVNKNPDKYGVQIRGAKITGDNNYYFHDAFNGLYYYIDQILTYDLQTRNQVLGAERWRVDVKTLSPDFMNNFVRGNYFGDDNGSVPDDNPTPKNGKNLIFPWDAIENFSNTTNNPGLVMRRPHFYWWSYEGDEMNIFGEFDMTIQLPTLPPGEWEIRLGNVTLETRPTIKVWLNGTVAIESLDLRSTYTNNTTLPYKVMNGPREYRPGGEGATSLYDLDGAVRVVLGRIQSDGKNANTLRLKVLDNGTQGNNPEFVLDYLEFCPASVCDNQEIPED